jgi:hypothetical protein
MSARSLSILIVAIILAAAIPAAASQVPAHGKLPEAFGKLPLTFEANAGQVDPAVRFVSRTQRSTLFLTPSEAVLSLRRGEEESAVVRMRMAGGNRNPRVLGENALPTKTNYFRGNDARRWRTDVANYAQVRYESVYPGIDVLYRGNERQVEYDFVIAPKANPGRIRVTFDGAQSMTLGNDGQLILGTAAGDLVQPRPYVYQEVNGRRQTVEGRYALRGSNEVGFVLGRYDRSRPLVIDPVLAWSTYLGGSIEDFGYAIAVDGSGNTYITGATGSSDFPTVGAIQGTKAYDWDVFVTKINAAGTAIVYSTFLGGDGWNEYGLGIAVDSSGNAYVTGGTNATDFPGVTGGSIQPSFGGTGSNRDAFATRINAAGNAIDWSTYLGGSGDEIAYGIAADSSGNCYVASGSGSTTLSFIDGSALQPSGNGGGDAFIVKIDSSGAKVYATFLGGSGGDGAQSIVADSSGNAWVAGGTGSTDFPGVTGGSLQSTNAGNGDLFLAKINSGGTSLLYATYFGTSAADDLHSIVRDGSGNIYLTGETESTTFPGVTGGSAQPSNAGSFDIYVTKLNSTATAVTWSTFLGGSDYEVSAGLGVDSSGNVYVGGMTNSTNFPVSSAIQSTYGGGDVDTVAAKINSSGTAVLWSTYLGGNDDDQAYGAVTDGSGNLYMAGFTATSAFPGTGSSAIQPTYGGGYDAYVVKISNSASPSLSSINPSSGVPGTSVTLTGTGFGAVRGTGSVWLGNKLAASITSWTNTQIVATVDSNVASGNAIVQQGGTWSNSIAFTIITPTISGISPSSARAGDQVTITGTNFGSSQGSGTVWLGSKYAASIVSWSATQIVATVASGAVSGTVQVQQSGVWGNTVAITIITPDVTSVSPTTARAGDSVTLNGTGFGSSQGSGSVWLGSKLAGSITSWSDTQIVATVASGAVTGTAQVQQGGVWDNYGAFTVITPVLSSISPTSGPVGTQVTFNGTGFGTTQGAGGKVWLANKYATIVSWSDTQVVATVIAGSSTSASQVLQGGVWSNTITFTVTP